MKTDHTPYEAGISTEAISRKYHIPVEQIIKLGSNENTYGISPKAADAARQAVGEAYLYPDNHALLQALSKHTGVDPSGLVLGVGSTEIIDMIARAFLNDTTSAVTSEFAFAMFGVMTRLAGAELAEAPAKDFGHDPETLLKATSEKTRVIWLANPNNPTGTFIPPAELKAFLDQVPRSIIVVLDEAYKEYLAPEDQTDTVAWLRDHPNLIVLRTFSKIYGMAGMRLGYGMMAPELAGMLNRVKQPLNINGVSLAAALAALDDHEFVKASYEHNLAGRHQLQTGFDQLGLKHLSAYGNFVTVHVPNGAAVNEKLLAKGIIVRSLTPYNLPHFLRVTVGKPEENARLLAELKQAL
jgi:histidinol-phosphate aminotransferase